MRCFPIIRSFTALAACIVLANCAAVDQFGTRIDDANLNSLEAANRETLLNIVCASRYQPLNFVAVTQITGGQTETLSTGLPTVSFGPAQTAAQHIYQISNSLSSVVNGSYQSNPLVSTDFQTGMLAPANPTIVAYLVAAHPREIALNLITEAIVFTFDHGETVRFRNDPSQDDNNRDCWNAVKSMHYTKRFSLRGICDYSLFLNYMEALSQGGLTAELISSSQPSAPDKSPPAAKGRYCFDPTRTTPLVIPYQPRCYSPDQRASASLSSLSAVFPGVGHVKIDLISRSPVGVYRYVGSLLRARPVGWDAYQSNEARSVLPEGTEPFLNITNQTSGCFTSVSIDGQFYCVPSASKHTALIFNILQELKNLSTTPKDLNAAFTVRVVGN